MASVFELKSRWTLKMHLSDSIDEENLHFAVFTQRRKFHFHSTSSNWLKSNWLKSNWLMKSSNTSGIMIYSAMMKSGATKQILHKTQRFIELGLSTFIFAESDCKLISSTWQPNTRLVEISKLFRDLSWNRFRQKWFGFYMQPNEVLPCNIDNKYWIYNYYSMNY